MLRVLKFGGSSVATTTKIKEIAENLKTFKEMGDKLVVVVSAMGKTTNNLIALSNEITKKPNKSEMDNLMSTGEMVTTALLAIALDKLGIKAISLTGAKAGIVTTDDFGKAFISYINPSKIVEYLNQDYVVVVAGFQGITTDGFTTTLGRGGSDTTAVALAGALGGVCEIYTDVDGVYTVDPRIYPTAKKLSSITFDEMMELSLNGAKVLETRSVELAKKYGVQLYLGKTNEIGKNGTMVKETINDFEKMKVSGLSVKENISHISITLKQGSVYEFVEAISKIVDKMEGFVVNTVNDLAVISFAIIDDKVNDLVLKLYDDLSSYKFKISAKQNLTKLTLVGNGLSTHKYFVKQAIAILNKNNIEIDFVTLNEISMSIYLEKDVEKAVQILSKEFDL